MSYFIEKHKTGYKIIIPAKKYYLSLLPRIVILLASIGLIVIIINNPFFNNFILHDISSIIVIAIFFIVFISFNSYILFVILWSFFGKEIIYLTKEFIIISRTLFFEINHRIYSIDKINNLNVKFEILHSKIHRIIYSFGVYFLPIKNKFIQDMKFNGVIGGIVEFYYENRKICFGINLKHEEGRNLVKEIREFLEYNL